MPPVDKFESYKVAIEAARHDTDNMWQTYSAFLISETFLLGFAISSVGGQSWRLRAFFGSFVALLLCIAWTATYARATKMRDLRIHQARELEEDPSRIMRDGASLVEGKPVRAEGRTFQLSALLSTNVAWLYVLILAFFVSDLIVIVWSALGL